MERTPILYDADCGFCRVVLAGVLLWDREHRLRPVTIQGEEGSALLAGMDASSRLASWHLVPRAGEPISAGSAFPPVLRNLPGGAPFAALTERFPNMTARAYDWVAVHRTALSRFVPSAVKRRADRLIDQRR